MLSQEEILENKIMQEMRDSYWYDPVTRARTFYKSIQYAFSHYWTKKHEKDSFSVFQDIEQSLLRRINHRVNPLIISKRIGDSGMVIAQKIEDYRVILEIINHHFKEIDVDDLFEHEKEHGKVAEKIVQRTGGEVFYGAYFVGRDRMIQCYTDLTLSKEVTVAEWIEFLLVPKEPSEEDLRQARKLIKSSV